MRPHTNRARDAALRRLSTANRLLIGVSAALTGVLTAVAAHAFPGKTLSAHAKQPSPKTAKHATATSQPTRTNTEALQTPAQPPQSDREPQQESTPTETPTERETEPESQSEQEESQPEPAEESVAPESEAQATPEEAPVQQEAPVVSGGS